MEYNKGILLLSLCTVLCWGRPDALPEALPDAEPEALADAEAQADPDPQYVGAMLPTMGVSVGGAQPLPFPIGVGGSAGQCSSLTDQCCGMVDQGCCISQSTFPPTFVQQPVQAVQQGQQCFTTYERKCRYANKPACQTYSKEFCENHPIKDCRYVQKREYVDVPVNECRLQNERQCFSYTGKECKPMGKIFNKTISWMDEELSPMSEKDVEKCHSVKTCKITERMETRTKKVPRQVCNKVPQPRRVCNSVPVPQPPQVVQTMSYRTEYRQQCYNIPKPVCKQVPCQYNVVATNICPTCQEPNMPGAGCGTPSCMQVGGVGSAATVINTAPVISQGSDMCGACRSQNVQMCTRMSTQCEMTTEQVCQQVPIQIPVPGTRTIPSPPKYEMKCDTQTDYVDQCRTVYEDQPHQVPVKQCQDGVEEKCFNYKVPDYTVTRKTESDVAKFETRECDIVDVDRQHCAMLPTRMDCTQRTVRRTVLIRQKVCDQTRMARYCNRIPYSQCFNTPGQECEMVPREVCRPTSTCLQNDYCNQCVQFANSGGFSQCSTSTCPNFVYPMYIN